MPRYLRDAIPSATIQSTRLGGLIEPQNESFHGPLDILQHQLANRLKHQIQPTVDMVAHRAGDADVANWRSGVRTAQGSSTGAVGVVEQRARAAVVDDAITSVARGGTSKEPSRRQGAD